MAKRGKKPRANPPSPKTERDELPSKRKRGRPPLSEEERAAKLMPTTLRVSTDGMVACKPADLRSRARQYAPAAMMVIHDIMMGGSHAAALRLRAAEIVMAYAVAKPLPTADEKGDEVKTPVDRLIDALTAKPPANEVQAIVATAEEDDILEGETV